MKRLKFAEPLPELVLKGAKDTTWRINDDKDLTKDEIISLQHVDGTEFGQAKICWTKITTFAKLDEEDIEGHEKFPSFEKMLGTYSNYYNMEVTKDTELKIIKFKLL